ncbi:MAG: amidohydrolase [Candidatus Tectomicrobia bacterium]|uniref:Amidohydrolase n=1 Tax=Tectimicrobiota bacterium TaxID=2528274 RepID=A0A933GL17_UNCTE|nr:amidohydrolase [Candidatus Tectomicrobia bacterium]
MIIVDTHVHASPYWFEPIEVLLFQMNSNGVEKATLVQYIGQTNNTYLIECSRRFPGRFSPVVMVDTERGDAPEVLKRWVKEGAEGVRLTPMTRSPGRDPLAIWRTCGELNIPVTCTGSKKEFSSDEFRNLIRTLANVRIIIEHLGMVGRDESAPYAIYSKILALADFPNTYIKVPGLGEICERPYPFRQPFPFDPVPPFIQMAYKAFGPSRMMWGSNYPPSSHLEGYRNTLRYLEQHLTTFCDEEAKQWILSKTALSLFKFQE